MEKKEKSRTSLIAFAITCATILIYLALLNGRYLNVDIGYYKVFDKWKREYISIKNHQNSE